MWRPKLFFIFGESFGQADRQGGLFCSDWPTRPEDQSEHEYWARVTLGKQTNQQSSCLVPLIGRRGGIVVICSCWCCCCCCGVSCFLGAWWPARHKPQTLSRWMIGLNWRWCVARHGTMFYSCGSYNPRQKPQRRHGWAMGINQLHFIGNYYYYYYY